MADPSPAPGSAPPARRWRAWTVRAVRLTLIALVLWLGWETVRGYQTFLAGPVPLSVEDAELAGDLPPSPADLLLSLPPEGAWTVPGVPWSVALVAVPDNDNLPTPSADRAVSREERTMLATLKRLATQQRREGGHTILTLEASTARGVVVLAGEGDNERLVRARLTAPAVEGRRITVEITPHATTVTKSDDSVPTLLPMPPSARCLARRSDRQQRTVGEVASVAGSAATLLAFWRGHDWDVRAFETTSASTYWLCQRGNQTIGVWGRLPANDLRAGPAVLLLVRVSSNAASRGS